jgi:hypothetical protein
VIQGQRNLRRAARQGIEAASIGALLGLATCAVACSGAKFASSDAQGGAGQAGKSSGGAAGEAAAGNASGGDLNTAGLTSGGIGGVSSLGGAGSGGAIAIGGAPCNCAPHQYCRDGSTDCYDCSSMNRMNFAAPERLATLDSGTRYPRGGSSTTDLFYADGSGLRYTSDFATSAGNSPNATAAGDAGPLLASSSVKGATLPNAMLESFNFLFDRQYNGGRKLFIANWQGGLMSPELAPVPYNSDKSDYSPALAQPQNDSPRLYWMTTRDMATQLVLGILDGKASAPVPVKLRIGQDACTPLPTDTELSPWVTSDGQMLLLSHSRLDANCAATSQGKDIYTVLLSPTDGQPIPQMGDTPTPARPMNDVNSAMDDVDPSFSADMCDLYFASNRDGKYAIYRAHRR